MKKIIYLILFVPLLFVACDDYLKLKPDGDFGEDFLFGNHNYVEGIITKVYQSIPSFYNNTGGDFLDCATDNAVSNVYSSSVYKLTSGGWSAGSNPLNNWTSAYQNIRQINLFLDHNYNTVYFDYDSVRNEQRKFRLQGEAYFLRAWFYWELLQRFAGPVSDGSIKGVPIVVSVLDVKDFPNLSRASYDECVAQIVEDCDSAINHLPDSYSGGSPEYGVDNKGRANALAALCLKSRVLLYAASPLFNPTNDPQKWINAAIAANEGIEKIGSLPSIPNTDFDKKYYNDPNHGEIIMRRMATNRSPENANFPPSFYGAGRTNPSQNLVDAFPMANGYPITDLVNSGYNPDKPYEGRDPRFGKIIIYHNVPFKGTVVDISNDGKDSESAYQARATRTGYYLRKWLSDEVNLTPGKTSNAKHYFALFRKAEFYLNYAEAANEAWGPTSDPLNLGRNAKDALAAIRSRAGIISPDGYLTEIASRGKEDFKNLVHNERRIELCFEGHRFYDIRRWKDNLNVPILGIENIEVDGDGIYTMDSKTVEVPKYSNYMYYGPLPLSEVLQFPNLEQNVGW